MNWTNQYDFVRLNGVAAVIAAESDVKEFVRLAKFPKTCTHRRLEVVPSKQKQVGLLNETS